LSQPAHIDATISSVDIRTAGTAQITVSDAGGAISNALVLRIENTPPSTCSVCITELIPDKIVAGGPGFTLTVNGSGFFPGMVVLWDDLTNPTASFQRPTTYVSSTQLTATIPASDIRTPGSVYVSVSDTTFPLFSGNYLFTIQSIGTNASRSATISAPSSPVQSSSAIVLSRPSRPNRTFLDYKVGVAYHAYGPNFMDDSFITQYHVAGVRDTVRAQLQGMADAGATMTSFHLWFVHNPDLTDDVIEPWRCAFPMSDQEQANLHAYAQDVAAIVGKNGNRMRMDLGLFWLGHADYTQGSPATGLGATPLGAAEFTRRVELTTDKVLAAISDVYFPDGTRLVDTIYLEGEVMIGAKANQEWFMLTHYPRFVRVVQEAGFKPAVYFLANGSQSLLLQDDFIDYEYPINYGHASMYWMYRSVKFLMDNHMFVPERMDISWYITDPDGADFDKLLKRLLDDADAVLPSLGVRGDYGIPETHYFFDPVQRHSFGQAFVHEVKRSGRLDRMFFWSTPYGADAIHGAAYPFGISDYLP
jgi:hypothetical protein